MTGVENSDAGAVDRAALVLNFGQSPAEYEADQQRRGHAKGVRAYRDLLEAHGVKPQRLIRCDLPHSAGRSWPVVAVIAPNPLAETPEIRLVTDRVNVPWGAGRGQGTDVLVDCGLCTTFQRQSMSPDDFMHAWERNLFRQEVDVARLVGWLERAAGNRKDVPFSDVRYLPAPH